GAAQTGTLRQAQREAEEEGGRRTQAPQVTGGPRDEEGEAGRASLFSAKFRPSPSAAAAEEGTRSLGRTVERGRGRGHKPLVGPGVGPALGRLRGRRVWPAGGAPGGRHPYHRDHR